MLKQPMQVYFDPKIVQLYKAYARQKGISFAAAVRDALQKQAVHLKPRIKKVDGALDENLSEHELFFKSIERIQKAQDQGKYYRLELTDNQLLYG